MDVGIGLPNAVPGTSGDDLVEFARRAEARGFSSLGTIDRIVYGNYEPLIALAAAAAVTERIGLMTTVLLGPLHESAATLAKQSLSLNELSGGRFTLGIGIGGREDDYEAAGVDMGDRGEDIDAMLERMQEIWADPAIGPGEAPKVLIGGGVEATFERGARFADGWIAGGVPPDQYAVMAEQARKSWADAGKPAPRLAGLAYFALGETGAADAQSYLTDYYAWLGEDIAGYIAGSAAKDAETVKQYLAAFEAVGCEELILFPSNSNPDQVDLLADAAGL